MRLVRFFPLPGRAAIWALTATALFCGVALFSAAAFIGARFIADAVDEGAARAARMASAAEHFAGRALGDTRLFRGMGERWLELRDAERPEALAEVEGIMRRRLGHPGQSVAYVSLFDERGQLVWSSTGAPPEGEVGRSLSMAGSLTFQEHRDQAAAELIDLPRLSPLTGEMVTPISLRLATPDGRFAGIAFAPVRTSILTTALTTLDAPRGHVAALERSDGQLIARGGDNAIFGGQDAAWPLIRVPEPGAIGTSMAMATSTGRPAIMARQPVEGTQLVAVGLVDLHTATADAEIIRAGAWLMAIGICLAAAIGFAALLRMLRQSERRRVAEAWQAGRLEIERLLEGLPAIIFLREFTRDGESRQIHRNGDSAAVSGWPHDRLAPDAEWGSLAEAGTDYSLLLRDAIDHGQAVKVWRMHQPDGSLAWMRTTMRLLERRPDGSGLVVGYTVNITPEREAEAKMMIASRMASLGEMGAGIAHELKQPLTTISLAAGAAAMLLDKGQYDMLRPRLDRIIEQTKRGAAIIENLRRFARGIDEGQRPGFVPLDMAVAKALDIIGDNFRMVEIGVEVSISDPAPAVFGHSIAIEQVLVNLLFNARDSILAAPAAGERVIRIDVPAPAGDAVILEVSDTGTGIDAAIIDRIFDPFFTTKGPDRGTGLGLAICHGIIRSMGGTITARNLDRGACFTISLPARRGEDRPPSSPLPVAAAA